MMTKTNEFAANPDVAIGSPETSGSWSGENPRRKPDGRRDVSGQVIGYARVSTNEQNLDRQLDAPRDARCDKIFSDRGVSGAQSVRPGLDALLAYVRPGDVLVVQSLDRLGRSVRNLLELVDDLEGRRVSLQILGLGVDTRTPAGQLVLTVVAAIAEMERTQLRERTLDGLAAARLRGRIGGRPSALSLDQKSEVRRMFTDDRPVAEIARLFRASERSVRRAIADETVAL